MTDPTAATPYIQYYKQRHYVEQLPTFFHRSFNEDTIRSASLSLFLFPCLFDRLWFYDGMKFWWRDINLELRRRVQKGGLLMVLWHCVEVSFHFSHLSFAVLPVSLDGQDRQM